MKRKTRPVFVITLRFSGRRKDAALHQEGHRQWVERGFAAGRFLAVGSLAGAAGGCILAHDVTRAQLQRFLQADPFVAHGVVQAEIVAFTPARADRRLSFLVPQP